MKLTQVEKILNKPVHKIRPEDSVKMLSSLDPIGFNEILDELNNSLLENLIISLQLSSASSVYIDSAYMEVLESFISNVSVKESSYWRFKLWKYPESIVDDLMGSVDSCPDILYFLLDILVKLKSMLLNRDLGVVNLPSVIEQFKLIANDLHLLNLNEFELIERCILPLQLLHRCVLRLQGDERVYLKDAEIAGIQRKLFSHLFGYVNVSDLSILVRVNA